MSGHHCPYQDQVPLSGGGGGEDCVRVMTTTVGKTDFSSLQKRDKGQACVLQKGLPGASREQRVIPWGAPRRRWHPTWALKELINSVYCQTLRPSDILETLIITEKLHPMFKKGVGCGVRPAFPVGSSNFVTLDMLFNHYELTFPSEKWRYNKVTTANTYSTLCARYYSEQFACITNLIFTTSL